MKTFLKVILPALLLLFASCEDVIQPDLAESEPRLVVEASLVWDMGASENPQYIRLTTTTAYFSDEIPAAEGALVTLHGPEGEEYSFEEIEPGLYKHEGFSPKGNGEYELQIFYEGEEYQATENLVPSPQLGYIEQNNNGGFGRDEIEIRAYYLDPPNIENYYLFQFYHDRLSLQLGTDQFTNGNLTSARFSDEELEQGDLVSVHIQGISERFYQYMYLLLSQSGNRSGPFQTQPTTVRGNVVNPTNPENFAFGYFRLSLGDMLIYEIQ